VAGTIDLSDHWSNVQNEMMQELEKARYQPHSGSSGEASELDWASWLRRYLPSRYAVTQDAFVVDADGSRSDQLDVIVHDRHYTPPIWVHGDKLWVPAESVYCIAECKPTLNREHVLYGGDKFASVRGMRRTSRGIRDIYGKQNAVPDKEPLGLLLCDRSEWTIPLGEPLKLALQERTGAARLHLGCAVDSVGFSAQWGEDGTLQGVKQVVGPHALVGFFAELIGALQDFGTVQAIDYQAYIRDVEWL